MTKAKQVKYIDLSQFPKDKVGRIQWKECQNKMFEFFYNDEKHIIEIFEYLGRNRINVKIDNNITIDNMHTSKLTNLTMSDLFYKPSYNYNVGDVINNLKIVEQCRIKTKGKTEGSVVYVKGYRYKCMFDGFESEITETDIKAGHGCPVCSSNIIIAGINDVATTHPHLVDYLVDKSEANKYSKCSNKKIRVECPFYHTQKYIRISDLTKYNRVTCEKCSDGISYPNKFAHELFSQLSSQYEDYQSEYIPSWANRYRYDNYLKFKDGKQIIVEMDGGLHFNKNKRFSSKNDKIKDEPASSHGIQVIRVDCNYDKTGQRFQYIKKNIIEALYQYFDLSNIDWDKCNEVAKTALLINVLDYYKNNPKLSLSDISKKFHVSLETIYNYMYIGEDLNLCVFVRNDEKRRRNSKPVAMYDLDNNLIGIYKSAKHIESEFPEKIFIIVVLDSIFTVIKFIKTIYLNL